MCPSYQRRTRSCLTPYGRSTSSAGWLVRRLGTRVLPSATHTASSTSSTTQKVAPSYAAPSGRTMQGGRLKQHLSFSHSCSTHAHPATALLCLGSDMTTTLPLAHQDVPHAGQPPLPGPLPPAPCHLLHPPSDGLDGTKEFIKRNGQFTVMIALIQVRLVVGGTMPAPSRVPCPAAAFQPLRAMHRHQVGSASCSSFACIPTHM